MMLPSRVRGTILAALDELYGQILDEEDRNVRSEGEDRGYQDGRDFVEEMIATVTQLIDGKTDVLGAEKEHGPLFRTHAPSWYLDYQRELAEIVLVRRWLDRMEDMMERLMSVPTLVLSRAAPRECRVCLVEAALCYINAQWRASAMLSRTAVESALQDRLPANARQVVAFERDFIRRAILVAGEQGFLSRDGQSAADKVRQVGNAAAHGRPVGSETVKDVVIAARLVIGELYQGVPEPETRDGYT